MSLTEGSPQAILFGDQDMKRIGIIALAVLTSCAFITSCMNTNASVTTQTTNTETVKEPSGISAGDHIMFGKYPQNYASGSDTAEPEPIEWRVLEIKDGKALIISEYLLEPFVYNIELTDVTWETSTLRKWLNTTFYDTAFSESEKNSIQTVTIKNPDNPVRGTEGGNDTEDKVFCLSLEEAQLYFKNTNERMAAPTKYAVKRGAQTNEDSTLANGMKTGWWWLRTPASSSNRAADVDCYGNIDVDFIKGSDVDGSLVFDEENCVRPAVWITIAEAQFTKVL